MENKIGIEIKIVLDDEKHKKETTEKIKNWLKKSMRDLNITGIIIQ